MSSPPPAPVLNGTSASSNREIEIKCRIRQHLDYTLSDSFFPELGSVKKGKVREIYTTEDKLVMIATDHVSAFDFVLDSLIPFKGLILNTLTKWAFEQTRDILPNALILGKNADTDDDVDPNVVIQKKMKNLNVEFIVRGYLWGSMAAAYEKGERQFCGFECPEGLLRYEKFSTPLFTPTTKAEVGLHDENMTYEEVEKKLGKELAMKAKTMALKLYERGSQLAIERNLVLVDTKYEFGVDENDVLHVIDEVNTPDSSRLCDAKELREKFTKIEEIMRNSDKEKKQFSNVSELIAERPDLKPTEFSKQFVRDILIERGFKPGKGKIPKLTEDEVVECVYRYIIVYERITGEVWKFPDMSISPVLRMMNNMKQKNLIKGCLALIFGGSDSDAPHLEKIRGYFTDYGIPSQIRICSAHKQPGRLEELLNYYNQSIEPLMIVACAGGTDALSGTASYHSVFPVVSCPPDGLNNTCLSNPPGSSNAFVLRPDNVAKFGLQIFSSVNDEFRMKCLAANQLKVSKLEKADAEFQLKCLLTNQ